MTEWFRRKSKNIRDAPMRVLITGSAGAVGTTLIKGMRDRHEIRGLDLVPTPDLDDALVGDVADYHTVEKAVDGMDALIHLANVGPSWDESLQSMVSTYNIFEAGHQHGVLRVAYASRAGVLPRSFYPHTIQRKVDMPLKPDGYYTISKVFGESIGYMYSARFGMGVVAVRIGTADCHDERCAFSWWPPNRSQDRSRQASRRRSPTPGHPSPSLPITPEDVGAGCARCS